METAHKVTNKGPTCGKGFQRGLWLGQGVMSLSPRCVSYTLAAMCQTSLDHGVPADNSVRRINEWT